MRAQYAVAADGAHSPVRERLGIRMTGRGSFSDSVTIYFRADCSELIGDRNLSVIYVFHPRRIGFFRFSLDKQSGFLVVNSAVDENGVMSPHLWDDTSEERCVAWVREALGAPDDLADRGGERAALERAGRRRGALPRADASSSRETRRTSCRRPAATAATRASTTRYNLAWKLAYVLDGRAAPELLDTYEAERQPVARLTVEQAYARYVLRLDKSLGTDDLAPIVEDALIDLGYRFRSAAHLATSRTTTTPTGRIRAADRPPRLPGAARRARARRVAGSRRST